MPRISQGLKRTTRSIRRRAEVLEISWKAAKSLSPRGMRRNGSALHRWYTTEEKYLLDCEAEWERDLIGRSDDFRRCRRT